MKDFMTLDLIKNWSSFNKKQINVDNQNCLLEYVSIFSNVYYSYQQES